MQISTWEGIMVGYYTCELQHNVIIHWLSNTLAI